MAIQPPYSKPISKGIALLAVVGNMVQDRWSVANLVVGLIAALGFFVWSYAVDGGFIND